MYNEQNFSIALPGNNTTVAAAATPDTTTNVAIAPIKTDTPKTVVTTAQPSSKENKSLGDLF